MSNTELALTKLDVCAITGDICNANPNICLYANGLLSQTEKTDFARNYLSLLLQNWTEVTSQPTLGDFSDTYWLSRCILKMMTDAEGLYVDKSHCIWIYCNLLIQEIPNISINGIPNSPFWLKVTSIINSLKARLRYEKIVNKNETVNWIPTVVDGHECTITREHPNIVALARCELSLVDDKKRFNDTCKELGSLFEVWRNVKFENSALEQLLFSPNRLRNSNIDESQTSSPRSEAYNAAINDICDTYWLLKAWSVATMAEDDKDLSIDKVDVEIIEITSRILKRIHNIDPNLTNFIDLCYFCDDRAKLRKKLE